MLASEYASIHKWLRKSAGKAMKCTSSKCSGESNTFDWALKRGKKYERIITNFTQLCRPCHLRHDFGQYMKTFTKVCGHRLEDKHFVIIRKYSRAWHVKEAAALRRIIEGFDNLLLK